MVPDEGSRGYDDDARFATLMNRPNTCFDDCPAAAPNPVLVWVQALERRAHIWRQRDKDAAEATVLYRSLDRCMREHFPPSGLPPGIAAPQTGAGAAK